MSKLGKIQRTRVESAIAWAQKQMRTAYHFTIEESPVPKEEKDDVHPVMAIERTGRGSADPEHFLLCFWTEECASMSARDLRRIAVHEVIHAITFKLSEIASREARYRQDETATEIEKVAYILARAFAGECGEK